MKKWALLLLIPSSILADGVIIPMLCDYLSLEGLKQLLLTIAKVKNGFNCGLMVLGILLNKVDRRRNLTNEVLGLIKKDFPKEVFKTAVPVCAALAEAPSFGKDIFRYSSWSTGATAYKKITSEILKRAER